MVSVFSAYIGEERKSDHGIKLCFILAYVSDLTTWKVPTAMEATMFGNICLRYQSHTLRLKPSHAFHIPLVQLVER